MPIADLAKLGQEVAALFVAFRAGAGEEDINVYVNLLAKNLEEWQWTYAFKLFTEDVPEDARGMFMPTVAQLVQAGTHAPIPYRPRPSDSPRIGKREAPAPFWKTEAEQEFYEAVVHDNPFEPEKENVIDYVQRVAILTGSKPLSALFEFRPRNAARFAGAVKRFRDDGGELAVDGDLMPCGCKGDPGILATMAHLVAKHAWSRDELATWLNVDAEPAAMAGEEA